MKKSQIKISYLTLLLLSTLNPQLSTLFAQGTAITYQGRLNDGGGPANGSNDFTFAVFQVANGSLPIAGPIKVDDVIVSNGLFTATVDFGSGVFTGAVQWLEIAVRPGDSGGGYTDLAPRQLLTPAPYAIYAGNTAQAATATYAATTVWSGVNGVPSGFADGVDNDTTYSAGLGLNLTGTTFSLNPLFTDGRYWTLFGNSGTSPGASFVGTTDNQPLELKVNNTRALRLEPQPISPNVIGGHSGNVVDSSAYGATIGGGGTVVEPNRISAIFSTVGGGLGNTVHTDAWNATISGGQFNTVETGAGSATISGGGGNTIQAGALNATVSGGAAGTIASNAQYSTIGGGHSNTLESAVTWGTVAGGYLNNIAHDSFGATIGGGYVNNIAHDSRVATIAGGAQNKIGTNSNYSAIGGGALNRVGDSAAYCTIAGGEYNLIGTNSGGTTISGGYFNGVADNSVYSTLAGGFGNDIGSNCFHSVIGGGKANNIADESWYAAIAGGGFNDIGTNASSSAIGGGSDNNIARDSHSTTIAGGYSNEIGTNSPYSSIGGGINNTILANADSATIPGGNYNTAAGDYSLAAGQRAKANHDGSFVWADDSNADFASTTNQQFAVRANNGVMIQATNTALDLRGGGTVRVAGAGEGTGTPVFIHRAITGNISGNFTVVNHPHCNNDPNAILIVTPNWNPGGTGGVYNASPIGVYYMSGRWRIFNQDLAPIANNAAFNVLVFKP